MARKRRKGAPDLPYDLQLPFQGRHRETIENTQDTDARLCIKGAKWKTPAAYPIKMGKPLQVLGDSRSKS